MKKKGFTLIELLVVVAIISLLSSVVLAVVNDARDKARTKAFRQDIMQFVNALELYKSDNGSYPGEPNSFFSFAQKKSGGTIIYEQVEPSDYDYKGKMQKYIKKFPEPTQNGAIFYYWHNSDYKCNGDTSIPPYVLMISSTEKGFEDLPYIYKEDDAEIDEGYRCFSLN